MIKKFLSDCFSFVEMMVLRSASCFLLQRAIPTRCDIDAVFPKVKFVSFGLNLIEQKTYMYPCIFNNFP